MMPEEQRSGLFDPDEEFPWDCDLPLGEWGDWEGGDLEEEE